LFTVAPFTCDTLGGDVYISRVESIFASHGVSPFLVDMNHCLADPALSGAFASCIRESIAESSILGIIATQLEKETVCALVWWKIVTHLTANDLRIGRVLSYWQAFFKLRCDDKDQFFSFYSKAKKIIHQLKTAKSDAVKDDHFLCALFARAIDVPELSKVTKKFLTVFNKTTEEILDLVHIDFSAVNTKELLEDGSTTAGEGKSNLRCANNNSDKSKVNFTNSKSKPVTKVVFRAFPKNTGEPFPEQVYKQMTEWYAHAAIPEEEKTPFLRSSSSRHGRRRRTFTRAVAIISTMVTTIVMQGEQSVSTQRSVAMMTVVVEELTLATSVIMREATVVRDLAMIVALPTAVVESTPVVRCSAGEMRSQ